MGNAVQTLAFIDQALHGPLRRGSGWWSGLVVFVDKRAASEEAKNQSGGAPAARRYAALVNAQLQADGVPAHS